MINQKPSAENSLIPPLSAPLSFKDREFQFTAADFERVRKLIYSHAGISLASTKMDMVYSRLVRRLRETDLKSFTDYLDLLERNNKDELEKFVNSLTTNLTSFFRESHHFPILAEYLRSLQGVSQIKIWCSAASTGEEPYSLAITACEAFNGFSTPVSILASDLDTNVLAFGSKGVYTQDRVSRLSPDRLSKFFTKGTGSQEGTFVVRPELRRMIEFKRINLLEPNWPVPTNVHAIFCRNVMIYFDKPTQNKILARFATTLSKNGLLFIGHSESFTHTTDLFNSKGKTVYELVSKSAKI